MGIFNIDGPVYRIGNILADILILGILWFFLAIPIFTIGASTTAVYYVFTKRINGKEGYIWKDFWRSFRQNFLTSTAVWLTLLAIFVVLAFNIVNAGLLGGMSNFVLVVQFVILVQATFVTIYIFPLISRFEMGYRAVFKAAFFLANRHILITISNIVLLGSLALIALLQPIFLVAVAGVYCYFSSFLLVKAFKKYRPDLDVEENISDMAPLQLDEHKKDGDSVVAIEITPDHPQEDYDESHYDSDSTVLNLERLKSLQEDKEQ